MILTCFYKLNEDSKLSEKTKEAILNAISKKHKVFKDHEVETNNIKDFLQGETVLTSEDFEDFLKEIFNTFAFDEKVTIDCCCENFNIYRKCFYKGETFIVEPEIFYPPL